MLNMRTKYTARYSCLHYRITDHRNRKHGCPNTRYVGGAALQVRAVCLRVRIAKVRLVPSHAVVERSEVASFAPAPRE